MRIQGPKDRGQRFYWPHGQPSAAAPTWLAISLVGDAFTKTLKYTLNILLIFPDTPPNPLSSSDLPGGHKGGRGRVQGHCWFLSCDPL